MAKTEQLKKQLRKKKKKARKPSVQDFVSTGSTLLNLAISDHINRGFMKGKYYHLVGDSSSGKTFLSLTCLAEAANNKNFDDYRFIYDNSEDGALMDISKFFGSKVAERIEPPNKKTSKDPYDLNNGCSTTIEEFYYNIDDAIKAGQPFIYILDSMDSLSSDAEQDKFEDQKEAHRKGKTTTGSFGDGKAKKNSAGIRRLLSRIRKSGSILIVISQTRDNFDFGFAKKTRSGGHALTFYATLAIWSSCGKKLKRHVKGKPRIIGVDSIIQTKKNRIKGKDRKVTIPIYYSFGFDDVGGCVNYLIAEGHWRSGAFFQPKEFDFTGTVERFIQYIEKNELEKDLRMIVQEVWDEIEEKCEVKRKPRYT